VIIGSPTISANFDDPSGIDTSSIMLRVDGVDVTSDATTSPTTVIYTPNASLPDGLHTVDLEVNDTLGNHATGSWSFTVETPPPEDEAFDFWWILIVLAFILFILLVLYFVSTRREPREEETEDEGQTEEVERSESPAEEEPAEPQETSAADGPAEADEPSDAGEPAGSDEPSDTSNDERP
jgi:hypothetical protein